jgi:predicted outer membrane repeat protein
MTLVLALLHALAADIDVPAGSDLAAVVDAAADGDRLLLADGQFDASGVELDGRDLTLIGQGSALTVISGATLVVGDGTVQLAELTVDGAGERRALELTTGAVTLDGVLVSGGRDLLGGGVHSEGGTVILRDSSFIDNQSFPFSGAHVYAVGGTVACERTTFEAGIARVVGTVRLDAADGTFTDCDFVGNTTEQAWTEGGGALYVSGGTLSVVGGLFSGNVAEGVGGGISAGQAATVHVVGARFEGNRASSGGGMACLEADSCSVLASEFDGNTAERGGGAYFRSVPDVLVEAGLFCENHAEGGDGGASRQRGRRTRRCGGEPGFEPGHPERHLDRQRSARCARAVRGAGIHRCGEHGGSSPRGRRPGRRPLRG